MGTREEASKLVDDRPLMIGPGPIGLRAVCVKHFTDRSWGFGQIDRRRSVLSLHEPAFLPSMIPSLGRFGGRDFIGVAGCNNVRPDAQ
jgi:hypothetical protein